MGDVLEELHKAREVFIEKATEQARHMAWVIAVIYSTVQYPMVIVFSVFIFLSFLTFEETLVTYKGSFVARYRFQIGSQRIQFNVHIG